MVETIKNTNVQALDSIFDNLIVKIPPVLSLNEVCQYFKVSRATINRLRSNGEIKAYKFGDKGRGKVLFVTSEIFDFLERKVENA